MHPYKFKRDHQLRLFETLLSDMLDMQHSLVRLEKLIDWQGLERHFRPFYADMGRPGVCLRLMLGLQLLKYIYGLSDEALCERWIENPYFQYFCGETFFQHNFPIERSGFSHFRNRVGIEAIEKLLQESLASALASGALRLKDLRSVAIDTTVQEKAIAHPTQQGLLLRAIYKIGSAAKKAGIKVRQSYVRVAKQVSIKVGRYLHAKQMKRAKRELRWMRTRLGRLLKEVRRQITDDAPKYLVEALSKATRIFLQKRGDTDYLYAWHAPEVKCISKGKARNPYEFGCKVALATPIHAYGGKHFILQAIALHGNPYDGHTLQRTLDKLHEITGRMADYVYVDKGYRGHGIKAGPRIVHSGQRRGITPWLKKQMRRRSVVEPIIGHAKNDGLLGRNYLKGHKGDQINAILSAVGFNFRQILSHLATA